MTIRVMSIWAEKILLKEGDHPHKPRVLLMAFSGKAAANIGKFCFINKSYYHLMKFVFTCSISILQVDKLYTIHLASDLLDSKVCLTKSWPFTGSI